MAEGTVLVDIDQVDRIQVETALEVLVGIDQADRIQEGMEYARSGNESLAADDGAVEDCVLLVGTVDCTLGVGNSDHRDSDGHK